MIDRIACTGKGICASVQTDGIELDEWGYPIVHEQLVDQALIQKTISLCPARAVYLAAVNSRAPAAQIRPTTPRPTGRPQPMARPR